MAGNTADVRVPISTSSRETSSSVEVHPLPAVCRLPAKRSRRAAVSSACCAALAGYGQGKDADQLEDIERRRLRQQAIAWLRNALDMWTKQVTGGPPDARAKARLALLGWQNHVDLAGIRDKDALARLTQPERAACQKLWDDVATLLRKIQRS